MPMADRSADCLPHARRICDRLRGERPCAGSRQSERPRSFASGLADAWAAIQGMTPARRAQIATVTCGGAWRVAEPAAKFSGEMGIVAEAAIVGDLAERLACVQQC